MRRYFAGLDLQEECTAEYAELRDLEAVAGLDAGPQIARGSGLSFVAQSFGEGVRTVGVGGCRRVLAFDAERRLVTVEAGVTLGELYDFLLPHGLYLPSQPGHPQISVGGCIANNVHGKNPRRDGLFADAVESLELYHPDHGVLPLSRQRNAEIFDLTCGGFGLTGVILRATLRAVPLPGALVRVQRVATENLLDTSEKLLALRDDCDFLYSWSHVAEFGRGLGAGYVCCGRFVPGSRGEPRRLPGYRRLPTRTGRPAWPRLMRPWPIYAVASGHRAWRRWRNDETVELARILYPGMFTGDFYFNLYGRRGFFAHMVLVPEDRRREYLRAFEECLRRHRHPVIALAMKCFDGEPHLLNFNGRGLSLHMHVSSTAGGQRFITALEQVSLQFGAIRTLYFDSRLDRAQARALYPDYDVFRTRLRHFDPRRRFRSVLSSRLDL